MNNFQAQTADTIANLVSHHATRRQAAGQFGGFCLIYLPHYFNLPPADFHPELISNLGDDAILRLLIEGFRGSAKSTFGTLALPLWLALERAEQYPFILPIADTGIQAAINISNIKTELENNNLLKQDYGIFQEDPKKDDFTLEGEEDWQAKNMLLSNGVRILARSRGQKVRGLRHRQHRPSAAIIDDPEDLDWVRTKGNRDKTERWLRGEVLPALDEAKGRAIVIGNLLHRDALLSRLSRDGSFKHLRFPLITKNGHGTVTWPGKYPNKESIEKARKDAGPTGFAREYLLQIVPEEGQIVKESDLRYYTKQPAETEQGLHATAFDLAISKNDSADYTAGVTGHCGWVNGFFKIYIQPHPINERIDLHELQQIMKTRLAAEGGNHMFFVEQVQYQEAAIREMERNGIPVEGVRPIGDKAARLRIAATHIKSGAVEFPATGAEDLIDQLLGFGIEEHDDLVDALAYLIIKLAEHGGREMKAIGL